MTGGATHDEPTLANRCPSSAPIRSVDSGPATTESSSLAVALRHRARRAVERMSGLSIYRRGPRGLNLYTDLASIPAPPMRTVLDVGAHRGESAAEFSRVWKGAILHCFEPASESF